MTVARILLDEDEADRMLDKLGHREFFEAAADEFIRLLRDESTESEPHYTGGDEG